MPATTHPSPPTPPAPYPHAAEDDARTARHLALLHELIDQGMTIARRLHAEATAAFPPPTPGLIERHALVVRGIRHTIALEAWLARTRRTAHAAEARIDTVQADRSRTYLRHRIDTAITQAGGRTFPLRARLEEHVANPGLDALFATRPFEEIVAAICRDLGIPPPPPFQPDPAEPAEPHPAPRPRPHAVSPAPDPPPATHLPLFLLQTQPHACSTGPP